MSFAKLRNAIAEFFTGSGRTSTGAGKVSVETDKSFTGIGETSTGAGGDYYGIAKSADDAVRSSVSTVDDY